MDQMTPLERWQRAVDDMVVCYVLTRVDTPGQPSLGRMCAQTHHCGTQMTEDKIAKDFPALNELYDEWQRDAALELKAAQADVAYVASLGKLTPAESDQLGAEMDATRGAADAAKRTFGTVLTLAVNAAEMRQTVNFAQLLGFHAGVTHDPTYPIFLKDGERTIVTTAPVDSCAYVFGRKSELARVLGEFDLLNERHIVR